jgi:hypothetical protein
MSAMVYMGSLSARGARTPRALGGTMRKEDLKARAAFQYREKKKELAMSMRRVKAWIEKHAGDADRVADLKDYLRRLELEDLFWTKHRKKKD